MSPLFGGNRSKDDDDGPRSAAEREAARLERERRRAAREGRPLPDPPAPPAGSDDVVGPPADAAIPEQEALDVAAYEPEPVYEAPQEPIAYEPDTAAYDLPPEPDTAAYDLPPEPEPIADPEPYYELEPVTVPADPEAPAGVRRVPAPSVRDLPQVAGARPAAAAGRGEGRGGAPRNRQGRGRVPRSRGLPHTRRGPRRLVPLILLLIVVAIGYFAFRVFQPFAGGGDAKRPVVVTIAQGATAAQIGDQLQKAGVIDSSFFFGIRSRVSGKRADLKAGRFTLERDMSYAAVLDALTRNPAAAPTVHVTIPEGRSISEAAPLVRAGGLTGSYSKAAHRNPRTVKALKGYGVPKGTSTLEGFLFPATYELKRKSTARQLVDQQLATFGDNYDKLSRQAARRRNLTDYDVLIIASMIEREAQVSTDRRLISAVISNRLKQHIPLGIDATLRYHLDNWTRPLRQSELQQDSAFNTRTRQGLPPTPIGSPGLASIKAALAPAKVPYLFYVVKPCGNGAHAFSTTDAQFQRDVAAYNKKRAQLGGKDPSHC